MDDGTVHYIKAVDQYAGAAFTRCGESGCQSETNCNGLLRPQNKEVVMRLKVDHKNDALYFRLDESAVVDSEE